MELLQQGVLHGLLTCGTNKIKKVDIKFEFTPPANHVILGELIIPNQQNGKLEERIKNFFSDKFEYEAMFSTNIHCRNLLL